MGAFSATTVTESRSSVAELSSDLPIVIEVVDGDEAIQSFLKVVDTLVVEGLVTLEKVKIVRYGA